MHEMAGLLPLDGAKRRALARLFWRQNYVLDRKSTRLNSSHRTSSYAVSCLKKKRNGWGAQSMIASALLTLAASLVWNGSVSEGAQCLSRVARVLLSDTGQDIQLLVHIVNCM